MLISVPSSLRALEDFENTSLPWARFDGMAYNPWRCSCPTPAGAPGARGPLVRGSPHLPHFLPAPVSAHYLSKTQPYSDYKCLFRAELSGFYIFYLWARFRGSTAIIYYSIGSIPRPQLMKGRVEPLVVFIQRLWDPIDDRHLG